MKRLFVLSVIAFLALAGEEQQRTRPYVTLAGARSEIKMVEYHRIVTQEELTTVWLKHVGSDAARHSSFYNKAGVPLVDFERCMVVAVFAGDTTNCAGIYPVSVVEEPARVVVRFSRRPYQTGPKADRVSPFGLFVVARSSKPLVLEESIPNLSGVPPRVEERKTFPALKK